MTFFPIKIIPAGTDAGGLVELRQRFEAVAKDVSRHCWERYAGVADGAAAIAVVATIADFLSIAVRLDGEYGPDGRLPIEDIDAAGDDVLRSLARLDALLDRFELPAHRPTLQALAMAIGFWAMRHEIAIVTAEPLVNALAERINAAVSRQDVTALYAMTQGFIELLRPALGADLERSNPMRPWRILNLNFAIAAIRSGDEQLMHFAFATLDENLPGDRAGFYAEALALAESARLPDAPRDVIRAHAAKWTKTN